jgi:Galactose oxidase, central domain
MTYEIFSSFKSHIIRWPRHLAMAGGLCLLVACGGGGGGSGGVAGSTTVQKPVASLALAATPVYANGKPAVITPTYDIGSGQLACTDKASGSVVYSAAYVASAVPVSVPLAADANCALVVSYKNTQTVRDEQLTTDPITTPVTVTPVVPVTTSVKLTATSSEIQPTESVTLTATISKDSSQSITKVSLIANGDATAPIVMTATADPLVFTYGPVKLSSTTEYKVLLDFADTRPVTDLPEQANSNSVPITVTTGPGFIAPGVDMATRTNFTATLLAADSNNISYVLVTGGTIDNGSTALKTAELYNPQTKKWITLATMTTARYGHVATVLNDGKVLITGGNDGKGALTTAEVYDPGSRTWTATSKPMKLTHINHTATLLKGNGQVLIAGGDVSDKKAPNTDRSTDIEIYTPSDDKSTSTDGPFALSDLKLEEAMKGHTATLVNNNKELLFFGNSIPNATKFLSVINVSTTTTSTPDSAVALTSGARGSINTTALVGIETNYLKRWNHAATLDASGNVLISGGFGLSPTMMLKYTPGNTVAAGTLSKVKNMTINRAAHTATLINTGAILFIGGNSGSAKLSKIELLDKDTGLFTTGKDLNSPRSSHISVLLPSTYGLSSVLIMGGADLTPVPPSTKLPLTMSTEIWTCDLSSNCK